MSAGQQTVGEWLEQQGLGKYVTLFAEQEIDWDVLTTLTEQDLAELGLPLGRRRKLLRAIANLSNAVPAALVELVPAGGPERRHVTLLFADLVGSTELSTQLDAEDFGQLMLSFQRGANAAITRSGGHVARYLGDGLLAYFGWPTAAENDAERAVRAGLDVVQATRMIAAEPHKLQVRIGIETGLVVIGASTGHGGVEELSVVGEAANLAARLQTVAEPDNVVIGPGTRQRLGGIFELSPQGSIQLKGFAAPVPTWQVLGESRAAIRFMSIHSDPLSGLIGRQAELSALSKAWEAAQQGHGQAILLAGEGGIGKSRIVAAFAQGLEKIAHNRLLYQCSAVHSASALHPVLRELEQAAGFDDADPPQARLAKLERLFDWSGRLEPNSLDLVSDWMGGSAPAGDRISELNPQLRKVRAFALLLERTARLAREQPLLVLLEDAHWSDPTTLELFRELLDRIAGMPVLVLITSRPEGAAAWRALPAVSVQYVTRLTPGEIAAMIDRIAGNTKLPPRIVSAVQDKTDGMPLFVEELTKAILESDKAALAGSGTSQAASLSPESVPATLQDSLMGRLDRLGWAKELAQTGAVLGPEFSHELMARVSDLPPARIEQGLERLVEAELLVRRGSGGSTGYIFRHALVQDVAYASLLRSRRRMLHGRVATILREAFPHAVETQPEIVARHLTEAQLLAEAIPWWRKAGQRSVRASSNTEAIGHFSRCLELLEQLPEGPGRNRQELEIRVELGVPLMGAAGYMAPEFTANFTRALELSREGNDAARLLFPALWAQWTATYSSGDIVSSEVMSRNFLKGAEQQGSRAMMVIGHRIHGITLLARGDLQGARRELEQALSLYLDADDNDLTYVYGQNQRMAALSYLCLALQQLGHLDQAVRTGEQAIAGASELGHFNTQGYALAQVLRLHMLRRDPAAMHRTGHALAALSEQHGAASWSLVARIAIAIADASSSSDAAPLAVIRAGIQELQSRRWNYWVPWLLLEEARVLLARHEPATVKERLDEAQHLIEAYGHRFCEPDLLSVRAQLLEERGETQSAAQHYSRAIDVALTQNAILPALRAATQLASLANRPSGEAGAFTQLEQIVGRFSEGLQSPDLRAAKEVLDRARSRGARL